MHKAGSVRAAYSISAFLLVLEILLLSGCAPVIPPEMIKAEDRLASGQGLTSTSNINGSANTPDLIARKKIILIVNSIINEEYSTAETIAALRNIQKDPKVARDLKVEAGYIINMVEIIDGRNKDIDRLQQKNSKCISDKAEINSTMKEKEARCNEKIEEIQKEKADLEFKLQKLEEIIRKSEKRRGLRK